MSNDKDWIWLFTIFNREAPVEMIDLCVIRMFLQMVCILQLNVQQTVILIYGQELTDCLIKIIWRINRSMIDIGVLVAIYRGM